MSILQIPEELKTYPNWVCWKYETRDGKPTKPPFDAKQNGKHVYAKTDNPATWASFACAIEAADVLNGSDYEGPGFVFTDTDFGGGDLDGVVHKDGTIDPFAIAIMKIANSYCEFSPSGTGTHIIFKSALPLPPGNRKGNKKLGGEIYNKFSPKYFTFTGDRIAGYPSTIRKIDNQDELDLIHFMVMHLHDTKLTRLWTGDSTLWGPGAKYPSQSEADLALCSLLAGMLNYDARKIEQYFGASVLGQRDKWTGGEGYRQRTIKAAIGVQAANIVPAATSEYAPTFGTADHITPKKIVWLWSKRFAQKLNLIVGNPDLGKGLITYYIAACCTTGRDWFDAPNMMGPSEVLLLNGEEDWDDTVVPRLMAAGADRSKVYWLKMSATKDSKTKEKELQLDRDMATLETFLEEHPAIRLVVVDPVSNYLGNAKMIDEQKIREVLTPLKEIANRRQLAVICVMHLNKKVELDAIHRIGGAMAFVGVARMVWLVAPKPNEDGTESDELLMVKVKGNIVQRNLKGLAFTTKVHYVPIEGEEVTTPYVEWIGDVDQNANQVTGRPQKAAHRPSEQLPACMDWLRHYLGDGAKLLVEDIEPAGKALHGFSSKTIQRARAEAGIITFPSGKRKAADGKTRDQYSCRLNAHDEAQIAEEAQTQF